MNSEQINKLIDSLEQPAERIRRAIGVIRGLQHECEEFKSRVHSLAITVVALQQENRRLRNEQSPTELDPRDARIVQLTTEVKRLQRLLDDMHAASACQSTIRAEQERRQHERDEYIREQGGEAAIKNIHPE